MSQSFTATLRTQLIWLTATLAVSRFLVVDCGSILHQLDLPEFLSGLPRVLKMAPFLDRASLVAASALN